MLSILSTIAPIFLLIGLGFAAARCDWLQPAHFQGMGVFVIRFALPALIFTTLADKPIRDVIQPAYLAAYGVGSLLTYIIGLILTQKAAHDSFGTAVLNSFGISLSNSGFVGYPVLLSFLGTGAGAYFAMNVMVEGLVVIPLFLVLAEWAENRSLHWRATVQRITLNLARNPLMMALFFGCIVSATGFRLPESLWRSAELLARSSTAVALFVIGGSLCGTRLAGNLKSLVWLSAGKLVLHPLMVLSVFLLLPQRDTLSILCAVLLAAAPMASIYPLMGQRFGQQQRCAAVLMGCTVLSFFSLCTVLLVWQTWFAELAR